MLATITLAADNDWVGVWIGSTIGMVAADALAIVVGAIAGKHLPERMIQIAAAVLFLGFGFFMLLENIWHAPALLLVAASLGIVAALAAMVFALPERLRPQVLRRSSAAADTEEDTGLREPAQREV